jgi:hypothetical protein
MSNENPRRAQDPDRPRERRASARPRTNQPRQVDDLQDQEEIYDAPEARVREPGQGPGDPIRFDGDRNVPSRETESAAPGPTIATGMFLPVAILLIVAIVLIVVFVI